MSENFWQKLKTITESEKRPIIVLAPLANVTDAAFRKLIAKYGRPDAMFTEFVSADGLVLAPEEGRNKLLRDLVYSESERPIVAQFFTSNPEHMKKVAELAVKLGFDGIDINMGCPDRAIEKQGAGAALMKNPKRARELIQAAKEGIKAAGSHIPVSLKTRVGFNKIELETWLPELLAEEPAVITIHARTRKEMSKVSAQWNLVKRGVEIRNELKSATLIFGNGDVTDLNDAYTKAKETGADGIMLGRAIFGNPWLFAALGSSIAPAQHGYFSAEKFLELAPTALASLRSNNTGAQIPIQKKLSVMLEHTKLFQELLGDIKNFAIMKKHYKAYVNGFDGAAELRGKLMEAENYRQVEETVNSFLNKN